METRIVLGGEQTQVVTFGDGDVESAFGLDGGGEGTLNFIELRYPDGRVTVWVINPNSEPPTVSEKRVVTGESFNGLITIREGIQADDVIVVRGNESLQEGQQVRIQRRE